MDKNLTTFIKYIAVIIVGVIVSAIIFDSLFEEAFEGLEKINDNLDYCKFYLTKD